MKKNGIKSAITTEFPFFMMMPALIWQVLFFVVPFTIIVSLSFAKNLHNIWEYGFTLQYYRSLLDVPYIRIIGRSLIFALFNAICCLVFAYPIAYYLARKVKRFKNFLLFFLILPFWTNILVQIYAWFFVIERNGLLNSLLLKIGVIREPLYIANTLFAVFLVMVYCYLPFMIMPLYSNLEKMNERLIESSYDLGANSWQTFFNVTLPLSFSGIKTGFFLVLVPSFGEFVIPALMGGSKDMFVGSLISHYFLMAYDVPQGAAFTMVSGAVLCIVVIICNWYFGKKLRVERGL